MSARAFFDAVARRYDRVYALGGETSRARMARVIEILRGRQRVLVLGLGTGRELPSLLDAGHDVRGIDVSPEMIAQCNRRSRTVPLVCADFYEALPFESDAFDAVVALHGTLAHPPRDGALPALAHELARVLAPGGVLVAEVPTSEALGGLERVGERGFVHRDAVAGVALEGVVLDDDAWRDALRPLVVGIEPLGTVERRIIATKA